MRSVERRRGRKGREEGGGVGGLNCLTAVCTVCPLFLLSPFSPPLLDLALHPFAHERKEGEKKKIRST